MSEDPGRGSQGEYALSESAHGTHGQRDMREHEVGERTPQPGNERVRDQLAKNPKAAAGKLTGEPGEAGWGSARAGDSSVDARSKKHEGSGGT